MGNRSLAVKADKYKSKSKNMNMHMVKEQYFQGTTSEYALRNATRVNCGVGGESIGGLVDALLGKVEDWWMHPLERWRTGGRHGKCP